MKKKPIILVIALINLVWNFRIYAFEGETHKALTEKAISNNNQSVLDNYLKDELGMGQGLNSVLSLDESITPDSERVLLEIPQNSTVLDLLKAGAGLEDIPLPRARHHFHDPYRNAGLENKTEHSARAPVINWFSQRIWGLSFDLTGASALKRASGTEGSQWESEYENYFAWPEARDYFYKSLTQESEAEREHYLALTFLSLGHTAHLLEDMGVPPHARNDFIEAHFRVPMGMWDNPLETYVEDEIKILGAIPSRWLTGWTPQAKVFSKLADYWDIGDYTGQYEGTSPPDSWGLSERTNYQFLSKSTIFRKNDGTKYYFPNPDVNQTSEHIDTEVYLWGLVPVYYKYISGYDVTHLARTKFIRKYAYIAGIPYPIETVAYHTTFDEAVYEDYADITIPRTIDYATGLTNYFFRGRLEVEAHSETAGVAQITITNKSMNGTVEQALKGGDFELYAYRHNGEAIPIELTLSGWSNGILAYGESLSGTFNIPALSYPIAHYYGVVYRGQIVPNDDTGHIDPDDDNAIAYGKTVPKAVLYFTNCAADYEDYLYDEDLANFRASYEDVKVGFYYTPIQWFPEPCPYCCTNTLSNIIPVGYTLPPEIYFETIGVPVTNSDINDYVYELLAGVIPELLIIVHQDRASMYYTEDDWNTWLLNPLKDDWGYPWPGDEDSPGILYYALTDWWSGLTPISGTTYVVYRHPWDDWLYEIMWVVDQFD